MRAVMGFVMGFVMGILLPWPVWADGRGCVDTATGKLLQYNSDSDVAGRNPDGTMKTWTVPIPAGACTAYLVSLGMAPATFTERAMTEEEKTSLIRAQNAALPVAVRQAANEKAIRNELAAKGFSAMAIEELMK